jgi:hypothetical protein
MRLSVDVRDQPTAPWRSGDRRPPARKPLRPGLTALTYRYSEPGCCQNCCQAAKGRWGLPPELVLKRTMTTTYGGGPEGIRTPDLLNAICRAAIRQGLLRSMSVFEFVRYRLLLSTAVAVGPPPAAVKCAVSLSAGDCASPPTRCLALSLRPAAADANAVAPFREVAGNSGTCWAGRPPAAPDSGPRSLR